MDKIEVKILNTEVLEESEKMMICAGRLTQRGHRIKSMDDFMRLYEKTYKQETADFMLNLPHPTLQKFGVINVVIVGASRRFLAQITRHQNEVKFMSASLQYSNYAGEADFVVPYELIGPQYTKMRNAYLAHCHRTMLAYKHLMDYGISNDSASYITPQSLRNTLIISATPYQWKHMINQRTCRRNTDETRYIMLRIWEELINLPASMFNNAGPFCKTGTCKEGRMSCKQPICPNMTPKDIIQKDFPLLVKEATTNEN